MNGRVSVCLIVGLLCTHIINAQASDNKLPGEVAVQGVEFVLIPAGWFWYSVENGERYKYGSDQIPYYRHVKIWLDDYYIAKYEARARDIVRHLNASAAARLEIEQWSSEDWGRNVVRPAVGCTVLQNAAGEFVEAFPEQNYPATHLTWHMADRFSRSMGFRLPTEAEWEKAARGSDQRVWPWGNEYPDDTYALFGSSMECAPVAVDAYPKGRSPSGLLNMGGNVGEYVANWFDEDFDAQLTMNQHNPLPPEEGKPVPFEQAKKIMKGGRWSENAAALGVAHRVLVTPERSYVHNGVRFAVDASVVQRMLTEGTAKALAHVGLAR